MSSLPFRRRGFSHPQPLHATPEPLLSASNAVQGANCVCHSCEGPLLVSTRLTYFLGDRRPHVSCHPRDGSQPGGTVQGPRSSSHRDVGPCPLAPAFVGRATPARATPALTPVASPQPSQVVLTDHRALQGSTSHGPGSPSACRRGGGQVGRSGVTVASGAMGRDGETGCPPWSEEAGTEDMTGSGGAGCSRPRAGVQEGRGGTPRPGVEQTPRAQHGLLREGKDVAGVGGGRRRQV